MNAPDIASAVEALADDGLSAVARYLPARLAHAGQLPWIPATTPGKWSMPLRFFRDNRGFVELLRMEPGVEMPLHRHTGVTHAYHLGGSRQLSTGEIFGPGAYEYEPPGNIDAWAIVGDEPLTALVIVMGEVEFLGPEGEVRGRANADSQWEEYRRHCGEHDLPLLDLFDP